MARILLILVGFSSSLLALSALADCVAIGFVKGELPRNPVYEVISCRPAMEIVELLRQSDPGWFGTFTYSEDDVVITVKAANEDARKLMWKDTEYWYYSSGCSAVAVGARFARPELRVLCCDVGPVRDLPCGVGGKEILRL